MLPHGKWHEWYRNGQLASERTFNKGRLTNIVKTWYPNGQLRSLVSYNSDGKVHGEVKWWTRDGKITATYYSTVGKEITINEYLDILNKIGYVTFP